MFLPVLSTEFEQPKMDVDQELSSLLILSFESDY